MIKVIIGASILLLILGFSLWYFVFSKNTTSKGPVTLTYWSLWEDENLIKPAIAEFEKQHPNIKVNFNKQSSVNYRTRVQTQIRAGSGPDVFRIHNSWLPMFTGDLAPAPAEIFSIEEYKRIFYPVALASFASNNQIFAAPMELDGLALFVNEDITQAAGVSAPRDWEEFRKSAIKMTVVDPSTGAVQTAGAALGETSNIDHWSDILGLLLLQQPGVNLTSPATSAAAEVFRFFTSFTQDPKKKTWDRNMPSSTQAFAQGRLGFYFAPSWRAHELRQANPNLKFKVVAVPQLPGDQVAWASFWGEAVSASSKNPKEAWEFIKFLTSAETQKLLFNQASQVRLFGEPYSRVELGGELANDPLVGAFVAQGPIYKFWYLSSNTLDSGINDEMIKYFEDGINTTLSGQDPQVALQTVDAGVKQILDKYSKSQAPAPTGQNR